MESFEYSYVLAGVVLILAIIKTVHFIKNQNRNWRFRHWFYFGQNNIKASTSENRARLKRMQNAYALCIYILLFVTTILFIFNI